MDHVNAPAQPCSDCRSPLTPALRNMFNWGKCAENDQSLFHWVTGEQVLPPASRQVILYEADLSTDDEDLLQMRLISGLIPCFSGHTPPSHIHPHAENDDHLIKAM